MSVTKSLFACFAIVIAGCGDSLNSLDGPKSGKVSGFVCTSLPVLTAAMEMPIAKDGFVSDGQCLNLRKRETVDVIRTVMMPGDGKYSQFELLVNNKTMKLWIKTSNIKAA